MEKSKSRLVKKIERLRSKLVWMFLFFVLVVWGISDEITLADAKKQLAARDEKIAKLESDLRDKEKSMVSGAEVIGLVKDLLMRKADLATDNVLGQTAPEVVATITLNPTISANQFQFEGVLSTSSSSSGEVAVFADKSASVAVGGLSSGKLYFYSKYEDGWYYVEYQDGTSAWVKADNVAVLQ